MRTTTVAAALAALGLVASPSAAQISSSTTTTTTAACQAGDPAVLAAASDGTGGAVVTTSDCATAAIAVTTSAKTNRTLSAGGYGIQRVLSVPPIDTLDLTQNAVASLPDLTSDAAIKKLVLASNKLTSLKGITFPSSLLDLDLSNNALPSTTAIGALSSLTTLTLTNTSLTDLSAIALPASLQTLTASFNQLTKVPSLNALSSLTTLTLTTNSIASFKDISVPPSVVSLDLSWNSISSFDGFNLPKSVTKLYIGGNRFTSLADLKTTNELTVLYAHDLVLGNVDGVTIPDTVSALSLMNCSLTTLSKFKLPKNLVYLDISKNQLTDIPKSYPNETKSVTANNNQLTQLYLINFAPSTTKLDFSGNSIAKVAGVVFPLVLDTLNFGTFPISEFEVRRSDVTTIQRLTAFNATVTQSSCSNPAAQSVTVKGALLCVIPDDVFAAQYGTSSGSAAHSSGSKSGNSWVLPVIICLAALVVIAVIVFVVRRRKANREPKMPPQQSMPEYSHTLANPSVFGDLPTFSNRDKQQFHQSHSQMNTINSFNTVYSNTQPGSGTLNSNSGGPEASLLKYRIQTHEITLQRAIAHGGFGAVYLASYQSQDVVVKKILPEKASDDRCLQAFLDEIKLNSTLSHPKVVRFIGVSWNTLADIAVIMEYMPNGDLDSLLKKFNRKTTSPDEFGWFTGHNLPSKSALALDILDAVVYLHSFSSPIIHRDLKAKNVLLSHNYTAKLSDFGVSREWQVDATMTAGIGTMAWIAPEVLRGERYTEKADIYSFGVILTELATCTKPFEGISNALIVLKVTSGEHRPEMGDDCPEDIRELGMRCLSYDAADRPSAMVAHYELKTLLKAHMPTAYEF